MKKLSQAELEIMMIIWGFNRPVKRGEIEIKLNEKNRYIDKTSVLTYLKRLSKKGFVSISKEGKNNIFTAIISEEVYVQKQSKIILEMMYHNSLKNFVNALYDGNALSKDDLEELKEYINKKV